MKVILEMFGKEVKIINVQDNQLEVHIAATTPPSADFEKIVPDTATMKKLVFIYKGKHRTCECGCTRIPILEFEGVQ